MTAVDGFSIPQTVLRYFDFSATPYTEAFGRDVARRRGSYPGGQLFLDQLLGLASIDGPTLYPPTSPAGLRRLIHTIRSAQIDRLKQDCFICYLLLDSDRASAPTIPNGNGVHHDEDMDGESGMELVKADKGKGKGRAKDLEAGGQAEEFARRRCLPQVWRGFMFGYWALDHGMWEDAVQSLINPAITSLNFLPSIFSLLSTHVSPPSSALSLIHTLFTALSPPLDTDDLIALRAVSLAATSSLSDCFNFIRVQPPASQQSIRETIYNWAFGAPRIPVGKGPAGVQGSVLTQLLHLPLQPEESAHLVHFLTHPPRSISPAALDLLHELVTVRLIHQGQYAECLALDKELAGSGAGKEEDRQKRRERVKEFISILPAAQRRVLELDGEVRREEGRMGDGDNGMEVDTEMSSAGPSTKSNGDVLAPKPMRLPALLSLTGTGDGSAGRPSSPAQRVVTAPARNVSSPFAGPPQFARTDSPSALPGTPTRGPGTPVQRLASGSPFMQPQRSVEVPRPARRIIDDDDEEEEAREGGMGGSMLNGIGRNGRQRQTSGRSTAAPAKEKEAGSNTEMETEEVGPKPAPATAAASQEKQVSGDMAPPPVPASSKPTSRKSSRQTLAPKQRDPSPPPPSTARSTRRQSTAPPPESDPPAPAAASASSARKTAKSRQVEADESGPSSFSMPGSFTPAPPTPSSVPPPKSRMTRSASRAVLDEDHPNPGPPAKRTRTRTAPGPSAGAGAGAGDRRKAASPTPSAAASEAPEGTGRRTTRRGTREPSVASSTGRRGVTPAASASARGGSPTGSVVSTRSKGGREGSMTPRVTRTRK
ncbi:nuclear pore complex assembly-domain-containing protein [Dioszegia hungarica]|uniref:Nuclear pore complex assembly-domain-containing protein n=1 Tax=Dioszegia hungarica TaxID=4972 RepID=A0AA38HFP3_9TREE|nr:nuclear pore complex assembly-domain-containing protein [Dioszegia hungarica]KAI9638049.1 nuclear pore complex assembly-domain-containing protein [Dioszegia hungarica]